MGCARRSAFIAVEASRAMDDGAGIWRAGNPRVRESGWMGRDEGGNIRGVEGFWNDFLTGVE